MQPWQAWSPPLRYLSTCASAAETFASCHKKLSHPVTRSTSHLCFDCRSAHVFASYQKKEAHATALQDHSMALHVVSASPSAAPWMCTWYRPFLQLLHWYDMFCMLMMVCLPAQVRLLSTRSEQNSEMSTEGRNVFPFQC